MASAILTIVVLSALSTIPFISGATSEAAIMRNCGEHQSRRSVVVHVHRHGINPKVRVSRWFFREASGVTVEGSVAAYFRNMLILNLDGESINIVLPPVWRVNSEVMNVSTLFEEGYIEVGDEVLVKAVQRKATNENGLSIVILLAYEIESQNGYTLYAVLPFNIEVENG